MPAVGADTSDPKKTPEAKAKAKAEAKKISAEAVREQGSIDETNAELDRNSLALEGVLGTLEDAVEEYFEPFVFLYFYFFPQKM